LLVLAVYIITQKSAFVYEFSWFLLSFRWKWRPTLQLGAVSDTTRLGNMTDLPVWYIQSLLANGEHGSTDLSLYVAKRSPFDFLAERRFLEDGRGDWRKFEPSSLHLSFVQACDQAADHLREHLKLLAS